MRPEVYSAPVYLFMAVICCLQEFKYTILQAEVYFTPVYLFLAIICGLQEFCFILHLLAWNRINPDRKSFMSVQKSEKDVRFASVRTSKRNK